MENDINAQEIRKKIMDMLFKNDELEQELKVREINYRGFNFRITDFNGKIAMGVLLDGIGYIHFKNCSSKSELWDTLNTFEYDVLF